MKRTAILMLAVWLLSPLPAHANATDIPCGDGPALVTALAQASTTPETDVVTLNPTAQAPCTYGVSTSLFISDDLTLNGNGAVIDASGQGALVEGIAITAGAAVTITGLTLQGAGNHGISNSGTLDLRESVIVGSGSDGVRNESQATLRDVTLRDNNRYGVSTTGSLTLVGVTISGSAQWGLHATADTDLINVTLSGNGGGVDIDSGVSVQAVNTLISDNGGNAVQASPLANTVRLNNVTIASNTGDALNMDSANALIVRNSIIWGNAGTDHGPAEADTALNNLAQGGVIGQDFDPEFQGIGNYRLSTGSPAIEAGNSLFLPFDSFDLDGDSDTIEPVPFDLAGEARVKGVTVDIGAYEADPPPPATATPIPTSTPIATSTPPVTPTATPLPTQTPPPTPEGPIFADVPSPNQPAYFQEWIEAFYLAGITQGCAESPLRYCPEEPVTRGAMAVFLLRAINYPNLPHTPTGEPGQVFADVPSPTQPPIFEDWIEEFHRLGITQGCAESPLRYCPDEPVTRGAMALFILRAFDSIPSP